MLTDGTRQESSCPGHDVLFLEVRFGDGSLTTTTEECFHLGSTVGVRFFSGKTKW